MKEMIKKLSQALNQANVLWGIGGSLLLKSYGLVEEVHDIDIIIAKDDIKKAIEVLNRLAKSQEVPIKKEYHTEYFLVYECDGVSIDVMSSFKIGHSHGIYNFVLDQESITKYKDYDGIKVPFTSLEDWLIAYDLMINRDIKVNLIRRYLETHGVLNPQLLRRTLEQELPDGTKNMIIDLLAFKNNE